MKYYAHIDTDNRLLGYYTDDLHSTIPTPNIELTHEQWLNCLDIGANKISSEGVGEVFDFSTDEDKAQGIRASRDFILSEDVDPLVTNPLRWADLTAVEQAAWTAYRQALLDVPQQSGFPTSVTWPTKP